MPRRVSSDAQILTEVLKCDGLRSGRPRSPSAGKGILSEAVVVKVDKIASPERNPGHTKMTHPEVFAGLGCMPNEYEIKLRGGVIPFNRTTPEI